MMSEDRYRTTQEYRKMVREELEQYQAGRTIEKFRRDRIEDVSAVYVSTGIRELDDVLGGGFSAGTIMLGAHSGIGKSTLCLQIAQNISAKGIPVFYYTMEMSREAVVAKAIARQVFLQSKGEFRISVNQILNSSQRKKLTEEEWNQLEQAREQVAKECRNLYLLEDLGASSLSGRKIRQEINRLAEERHAVVFVDYLQILGIESEKNARPADARGMIEENVRELRLLAGEMKIPVVIINSLNRSSYGKPVTASAFKESGMIEYSADVVLALQFRIFSIKRFSPADGEMIADHEKSQIPRREELLVLKQRYGRSGEDVKVPFQYFSANDCFLTYKDAKKLLSGEKGEAEKLPEKEENEERIGKTENHVYEQRSLSEEKENRKMRVHKSGETGRDQTESAKENAAEKKEKKARRERMPGPGMNQRIVPEKPEEEERRNWLESLRKKKKDE